MVTVHIVLVQVSLTSTVNQEILFLRYVKKSELGSVLYFEVSCDPLGIM